MSTHLTKQSKFFSEGIDSQTDSGHFISCDAAIYGYIRSTFRPGFVDVKFLWYFLIIGITCNLHEAL